MNASPLFYTAFQGLQATSLYLQNTSTKKLQDTDRITLVFNLINGAFLAYRAFNASNGLSRKANIYLLAGSAAAGSLAVIGTEKRETVKHENSYVRVTCGKDLLRSLERALMTAQAAQLLGDLLLGKSKMSSSLQLTATTVSLYGHSLDSSVMLKATVLGRVQKNSNYVSFPSLSVSFDHGSVYCAQGHRLDKAAVRDGLFNKMKTVTAKALAKPTSYWRNKARLTLKAKDLPICSESGCYNSESGYKIHFDGIDMLSIEKGSRVSNITMPKPWHKRFDFSSAFKGDIAKLTAFAVFQLALVILQKRTPPLAPWIYTLQKVLLPVNFVVMVNTLNFKREYRDEVRLFLPALYVGFCVSLVAHLKNRDHMATQLKAKGVIANGLTAKSPFGSYLVSTSYFVNGLASWAVAVAFSKYSSNEKYKLPLYTIALLNLLALILFNQMRWFELKKTLTGVSKHDKSVTLKLDVLVPSRSLIGTPEKFTAFFTKVHAYADRFFDGASWKSSWYVTKRYGNIINRTLVFYVRRKVVPLLVDGIDLSPLISSVSATIVPKLNYPGRIIIK